MILLRLLLGVILIAVIVMLNGCVAEAAECLPNAKAVWAKAPHAHATWRLRDGRECWYAGWPVYHARHSEKRIQAYRWASNPVPLPRPRGDFEILYPMSYPRLTPYQGRMLADELLLTERSNSHEPRPIH